jgi:putative ABC transport system substrate-binding protein
MKHIVVRFLAIFVTLATCGAVAEAQQPGKIPRIGFVSGRGSPTPATPDTSADAFRQGLQDLGYVEGKNILVDYRYAEGGDRVSSLVSELVKLKVDVLVSASLRTIRAAKQATNTIPIVMVITEDPVATGMVDSLARPGGNITGITRLTRDLSGKRLELLKEVVPAISRVGILWEANTTRPNKDYETAAHALKIKLESFEVAGANPGLNEAFRAALKWRANALIAVRTSLLVDYRKQIADLATMNRLPLMSPGTDFAESGSLLSYAASNAESFRRAAVFVDKILKGVKPADLPVEQPTKFEFVINLKTAKQIGLTISPNVLARADRVIR